MHSDIRLVQLQDGMVFTTYCKNIIKEYTDKIDYSVEIGDKLRILKNNGKFSRVKSLREIGFDKYYGVCTKKIYKNNRKYAKYLSKIPIVRKWFGIGDFNIEMMLVEN